jgi:hypothetical protein
MYDRGFSIFKPAMKAHFKKMVKLISVFFSIGFMTLTQNESFFLPYTLYDSSETKDKAFYHSMRKTK